MRKILTAMTIASTIGCSGMEIDTADGVLTQAARPGGSGGGLPAGALLPNIVEEAPFHINIQNEHQRTMLRYTTTHWNAGDGPLQVRGGDQIGPCDLDGVHFDQCTLATQEVLDTNGNIVYTQPAGASVFHPAHNHWHQSDVANFRLRAGALDGPIMASSDKVTFCLIDFDKSYLVKRNAERVYWECNGLLQGISVNWGDEYHQATEGQELDITGVAPGIYYLVFEGDPTNHWLETQEADNTSWAKLRLYRESQGNMKLEVLELSACEGIACGNTANK